MFEKIMILIALVLMLCGVLSIFLARDIAKKKVERYKENRVTYAMKLLGFIDIVLCLGAIYFLTR